MWRARGLNEEDRHLSTKKASINNYFCLLRFPLIPVCDRNVVLYLLLVLLI